MNSCPGVNKSKASRENHESSHYMAVVIVVIIENALVGREM